MIIHWRRGAVSQHNHTVLGGWQAVCVRIGPAGESSSAAEEEPYESWASAISSIAGLLPLLAEDAEGSRWCVFNEPPDSDKNFPKLIWDDLTLGKGSPVDVETYDAQDITFQVSLVIQEGKDPRTILNLVDRMESAWYGGAMDTDHWKILSIRRPGGWQRVDWEQRLVEGHALVQYTADFIYRFNRKQNVA